MDKLHNMLGMYLFDSVVFNIKIGFWGVIEAYTKIMGNQGV